VIDAPRTWRECFPALAGAAEAELVQILDAAPTVRLSPGEPVFAGGRACDHYLLVLDGDVRVQLIAENGREVTLYRVRRGDSCVLTTACLLGGDDYPADAVTESAVTAIALPRGAFDRALDVSPAFRRFVFRGLGARLSSMMRRMDEVTFGEIDTRLARALVDLAGERGAEQATALTHQMLAVELGTAREVVSLGTAREVVSRHLKRFESRGWVALGRGHIRILDPTALEDLCRAGAQD
jgi:CRP/FNR family transcriptional regulator